MYALTIYVDEIIAFMISIKNNQQKYFAAHC